MDAAPRPTPYPAMYVRDPDDVRIARAAGEALAAPSPPASPVRGTIDQVLRFVERGVGEWTPQI